VYPTNVVRVDDNKNPEYAADGVRGLITFNLGNYAKQY
jgi:hypothetical protein